MSALMRVVRAQLGRAERRDALVDGGFVLGLGALALVGFQAAYGGDAYLVIGVIALALGILVAACSQRLRQPVFFDVAVVVAFFFLLGGVIAAPANALGGVIPTLGTTRALVTVATQGWKELLTTVPPVGNSANLLAIPYLIGLVAGASGYALARRTRVVALPVLAPALVLALSILFGSELPPALLLQGSLFAVLVVLWLAVRHRRFMPPSLTSVKRPWRLAWALGVVVVAGLLAPLVGPNLPFGGRTRTVLSQYIVPPFNATDQPSPLGAFRKYTPGAPQTLANATLFTVSGVSPGALMRIATMDSYDGLAWGFGGEGSAGGTGAVDVFRHYGATIGNTTSGTAGRVSVQMGDLHSVWVPSIGETTSIHFSGPDAAALTSNFDYDPATATAADSVVASAADGYDAGVVVPATPTTAQLSAAAPGTVRLAVQVPGPVQTTANSWAGGTTGAWAKVLAVVQHLKTDGRYSDGTETPPIADAGHSAGRLTRFVLGVPSVDNPLVGDDEQFASTLALMANALGVPARVVIGAQVGPSGRVTGSDVHAWVQVSLASLGWVSVTPDVFIPTTRATQLQPQPEPIDQPQAIVPPPTVTDLRPPPDRPLQSTPSILPTPKPVPVASRSGLPAWLTRLLLVAGPPILLLAAICGVILRLKARRRRRRRRLGDPCAQVAGAWNELIDIARDFGHPLPGRRTRREYAQLLAAPGIDQLARRGDSAVFGPGQPSADEVTGYWRAMGEVRRTIAAPYGRWKRIRAALSLRSLREMPRPGRRAWWRRVSPVRRGAARA